MDTTHDAIIARLIREAEDRLRDALAGGNPAAAVAARDALEELLREGRWLGLVHEPVHAGRWARGPVGYGQTRYEPSGRGGWSDGW